MQNLSFRMIAKGTIEDTNRVYSHFKENGVRGFKTQGRKITIAALRALAGLALPVALVTVLGNLWAAKLGIKVLSVAAFASVLSLDFISLTKGYQLLPTPVKDSQNLPQQPLNASILTLNELISQNIQNTTLTPCGNG